MIQANNINGDTLYAPRGYWTLTPAMKKFIVNGVGPKALAKYIPNTILGLDITEEANVHDYCWFFGYNFKDSNDLFYYNVKRSIKESGGWKASLRHVVNEIYYALLYTTGHLFYKQVR